MNEPEPPIDDELVSAVLDGEATPDERALVEASAAGRRRLEQLRRVRDQVQEPVDPLSGDAVDRLVGRALAGDPAAPVEGVGGAGPATVTHLGSSRPRHHEPPRRRWGPAVAAAAAVVVVIGGIVALAGTAGRGSDSASDSSSSAADTVLTDGAGAADQARPESSAGGESANDASSASMPPSLGLGAQPDPEAVIDAYQAMPPALTAGRSELNDQAQGEQQFGMWFSAECLAEFADRAPGPWQPVATASIDGEPVRLIAVGPTSAITRLLVIDEATCVVLADRAV